MPALPFDPEGADTVIVAYTLDRVDLTLARQLLKRGSRQILFEHATCWTDPPVFAADVTTFLHQSNVAPWDEHMIFGLDGSTAQEPADDRPPQELAEEIFQADPIPNSGDGATPADADDDLCAFVSSIAGYWPAQTRQRGRMRSPGPVSSSQFR